MPIEMGCSSCGQRLQIAEEVVGQLLRCPECKHEFSVACEKASSDSIGWSPDKCPPPVRRGEESGSDRSTQASSTDHQFREGEPVATIQLESSRSEDGLGEFDENPRRRRDLIDLAYVTAKIRGPANGLIVVAGANLLIIAVRVGFICYWCSGINNWKTEYVATIAVDAIFEVFQLACSVLVLFGARQMKRIENRGIVLAAAIVAMFPFAVFICVLPGPIYTIPFGLIGIPLGWRALAVVRQSDVALAFEEKRKGRLNVQ
jgi:predicted RNA-binding Zn-ribbon protein involved in translation (DUF1610 family)